MLALLVPLAPRAGRAQPDPHPAPAGPAPADAAEQADRHFDRGQAYYDEGRYEEAIVEYRAAYRIKPHPYGLFNIAQSYERLQQYREAVQWFERFLREVDADEPRRRIVENRLRALRNLPARVHVDCVPPATARLIDQDGVVEEAQTPHLFKVKAGRYTLQLVREGYLPQERRIIADIGQPYFYQFTLHVHKELVQIRPNPTEARVFLDNKLVGTGIFADRIPVGKHALFVEYGSHEPYATAFVLKPGHKMEYNVVLKPPPPQGRLEFVSGMAVYGALAVPLGLHASGLLTLDDQLLMFSSAMGGAGLFAFAGFMASRGGIREANASLMTAGTLWGGVEGLALAMLTDRSNTRLASGLTLASSVAGLTTALLLIRPLRPTPGNSAMLHSGGLWGSALGLGLGYAIRGDRSDLDFTLLIGLNVGLITSGVLINHFEVSRMHMFLIDLGALAGAAAGLGVACTTASESCSDLPDSHAGTARLARGALLGGTAGLAVAIIVTRNWDRGGRTVTRDSLVSLAGGHVQLGWPRPEVTLLPRADGRDGSETRVTLRLASGSF